MLRSTGDESGVRVWTFMRPLSAVVRLHMKRGTPEWFWEAVWYRNGWQR